MTPLEIRFLLSAEGLSQTAVGKLCGVSQPSVWRVIEGKSRSKSIELCISNAVGLPLHKLWPQWYRPDGGRVPKRRRHFASSAEAFARLEALELHKREVA